MPVSAAIVVFTPANRDDPGRPKNVKRKCRKGEELERQFAARRDLTYGIGATAT